MIGPGTAVERKLRESAVDEAAELFARHGDKAIEILIARIHDPAHSPVERRRCRLARLEVERLGRAQRVAWNPSPLVLWQPPLFSWAGMKRLFGRRSDGTTRRDGR